MNYPGNRAAFQIWYGSSFQLVADDSGKFWLDFEGCAVLFGGGVEGDPDAVACVRFGVRIADIERYGAAVVDLVAVGQHLVAFADLGEVCGVDGDQRERARVSTQPTRQIAQATPTAYQRRRQMSRAYWKMMTFSEPMSN